MKDFFPSILEVAKEVQGPYWRLADALLKAFPRDPFNRQRPSIDDQLAELSEYLYENGVYFKPRVLRGLRETAYLFPIEERVPGISVWTHKNAGNPDELSKRLSTGEPLNQWKTRHANRDRDRSNDGSRSEGPRKLEVILSRARDLADAAERISRGMKPSTRLAKQAILLSESFGRSAAMLSPTRKEYIRE